VSEGARIAALEGTTVTRLHPLLASLALALTLIACGGGSDIDVSSVDAEALMTAAAARLAKVQQFHFVLEHERGSTAIVRGLAMSHAEGDVDGFDRLRADIEAKAGPLNLEVSVVIIEGEGWITNPVTGRWERETLAVGDLFDPSTGLAAIVVAADSPRLSGTDRVNGADTYRVETTVDSGVLRSFVPGARAGMPVATRSPGSVSMIRCCTVWN